MPLPIAHAGPWLEALLFAPAAAVVVAAAWRDRRAGSRRRQPAAHDERK